MDEVFARRDVIDAPTLKRLCAPSDLKGAVQTLSHLGALGVTGTALSATWGSAWAILPFMVHGALLNFLYAGQHELSHWTVFQTRALNEWVGRLFGFVLFYPRTFDQVQHVAARVRGCGPYPDPSTSHTLMASDCSRNPAANNV